MHFLTGACRIYNCTRCKPRSGRRNRFENGTQAEPAPELSLRMAVDELPAGELQNAAVISIIQRWAQRNPEVAAAWVGQFQAEPLRRVATRNLVDVWSEGSWDGPARWLDGPTVTDLRDAGESLLAHKLAVLDTTIATEWAKVIIDPALRQSTLLAISEMADNSAR
jgi:hypothetical protein